MGAIAKSKLYVLRLRHRQLSGFALWMKRETQLPRSAFLIHVSSSAGMNDGPLRLAARGPRLQDVLNAAINLL